MKTTGGKGLHVVFPLTPQADWDTVKAFAQSIASAMAADRPDLYTDNMAKSGRRGRIYVDYLRNGMGATAIGAYSTRAREGAPVSVPLAWDELGENIRSSHFTAPEPAQAAGVPRSRSVGGPGLDQADAAGRRRQRAVEGRARGLLEEGLQAGADPSRAAAAQADGPALAKPPKAVRKLGDERFWIDSVDGLLGLVEMGAVELSAANVTIDDLERPDMLVLSVTAADTALRLRTLLKAEGLESWPKLTGGRELHVMVPIEPDLNAAGGAALQRAARRPAGQRQHRLPLQQAGGRGDRRLLAARRSPGFPIAAPVEWSQLQRGLAPDAFTMKKRP